MHSTETRTTLPIRPLGQARRPRLGGDGARRACTRTSSAGTRASSGSSRGSWPTTPTGTATTRARAAWIAELDGARVGCVFCVPRTNARAAQLRILLVHPDAPRSRARAARSSTRRSSSRVARVTSGCGCGPTTRSRRRVTSTSSRGFRLVDEQRHHSFGVDLIGQTYALELDAGGKRLGDSRRGVKRLS